MNKTLHLLLPFLAFTTSPSFGNNHYISHNHDEKVCEGYFPEELGTKKPIPAGSYLNEGISKEVFEARNKLAYDTYKPFVKAHDGVLEIANLWDNPTVNAGAGKEGSHWGVAMYGGLARLKNMTADAYTLVLCHEIGHLVGGFPFHLDINLPHDKLASASEGNSDYFASHDCFYRLFKDDTENNQKAEETASEEAKEICTNAHDDKTKQQICMRSVAGGEILVQAFHDHLESGVKVSISTPDPKVAYTTTARHPEAQCRVDTTVAGATCAKPPYPDHKFPLTLEEMNDLTCGSKEFSDDYLLGVRPKCWFIKEKIELEIPDFADHHFQGEWKVGECFEKKYPDGQVLYKHKGLIFSYSFEGKGILTTVDSIYSDKKCTKFLSSSHLSGKYSFSVLDQETKTRDIFLLTPDRKRLFDALYSKVKFTTKDDKMLMFVAKPSEGKDGKSPETRATEFEEKPFAVRSMKK